MEDIKSVHFDRFKIDPNNGLLHDSGARVKLRPKELSLLWLLVRQPGKIVSKKHIINEVWHGRPASDESIARCISVIKMQLRSFSPGADLHIKTEYSLGYRFTGSIRQKNNNRYVSTSITIGDIASKNILTCAPGISVSEAASLLFQNKTSSIIILRNQKPAGIWTEADALNLNFNDPSALELPIRNVMQSPVITIEKEKPVAEAVSLMRSQSIRHLVVMDGKNRACGVVSQSDILHSQGVESFMTVKDVKSVAFRSPMLIVENLTVAEMIVRMRRKHTDILIIQLDHQPMFSFTEHEVIELIVKKNMDLPVSRLNIKPLVTISEDTSILVARQLMDVKKVKHLAVLDREGNFVKILSQSDIFAELENSYNYLLEKILEQSENPPQDERNQLFARAIQQTAGMMIITDKEGDIEYVNESFERISGHKLDRIKGKNPRFLSSGVIDKAVFKNMWETLNAGKVWKGELCNKKKNGDLYWVLSSITPIVDENGEIHNFIAVEEDITERKEVELRLHEIEQRFYEMIDHSLIMIWESDSQGKFYYFNNYWFKFTGRELQEEYGNGWADHIHPDDLMGFLETFQNSILHRRQFCLDHRLKNAQGEYRWVMNSGLPRFDKNDEFIGFRGACVDITEKILNPEQEAHSKLLVKQSMNGGFAYK